MRTTTGLTNAELTEEELRRRFRTRLDRVRSAIVALEYLESPIDYAYKRQDIKNLRIWLEELVPILTKALSEIPEPPRRMSVGC